MEGLAPLAGLRALEFGSMLAGPFVGAMLADFGADVIKVEKPGKPDALREWPPHKNGVPLWWKSMSRNKRLITLDISRREARGAALKLIAGSDVVIENFRPGTLERWGLAPSQLAEAAPRTVWVRLSGYGQYGPYSTQGGYATIAECYSGLAAMTGFADRGPMVSAFPLGDYLAGIFGSYGALVALRDRDRTGRGQVVDVSLFEPLLRILESAILRYDQTGQTKPRLGNQMEEDVPRNIYRTRDGGFIAISCGSQRIFDGLMDAIGRPDLKTDPRFTSMASRVDYRKAIDDIVRAWMEQQATRAALETLSEHHVVAGKVNGMDEVLADDHVRARGAIVEVKDEDLGVLRMPAPVPRLSRTPGRVNWSGRSIGADTAEVLDQLLTPEEVERLRHAGVI